MNSRSTSVDLIFPLLFSFIFALLISLASWEKVASTSNAGKRHFFNFLFSFKMLVKYTYPKIYHLNHYSVHSSVVLNTFKLCYNQSPELTSCCEAEIYSWNNNPLSIPFPKISCYSVSFVITANLVKIEGLFQMTVFH